MHFLRMTNALLLTLAIAPGLGHGADIKAGQTLHDANCVKCHGSEVYTREDRRITSLDNLRQQVERCDTNIGLSWYEDEIENVTQYLNDTYYKFK